MKKVNKKIITLGTEFTDLDEIWVTANDFVKFRIANLNISVAFFFSINFYK